MYQIKNCKSTAENNFEIFFEETSWTLDEGIIGWKTKKDCPLEFTSANSERHIATLNKATLPYEPSLHINNPTFILVDVCKFLC